MPQAFDFPALDDTDGWLALVDASNRTNLDHDPLGLLEPVNRLYAAGRDLAHPHLSPIFGDVGGFPPTCLLVGTRELFVSNAARMQRALLAADVPVELHLIEGMHHLGFDAASPETSDVLDRLERFERRVLGQPTAR